MKLITLAFICLAAAAFNAIAQADLQKLVDAEHAFAALAAEKGTQTAFLENMADDAVIFVPDKTRAKEFWTARTPNASQLSWAPNFADVSSNGILGYTTGNWEFRAKGKEDAPLAFGDFVTVWLRQLNGKYKFVVDIGIDHPKPDKYSTQWSTGTAAPDGKGDISPGDLATEFFKVVTAKGIAKAYEAYAADDIRVYRDGKLPVLGKRALRALVSGDKTALAFAKRGIFFCASDLAYTTNAYTRALGGKTVEKGNFMQIWKFRSGRWQIVLDIFKPVPEK